MKEVIEKLDAIEAANVAKVEEIKGEVAKSLEEVKTQVTEQVAALEAKVAAIQTPAIIKIAKSVREDVNRSVKEQLRDFYKSSRTMEKEIKMFADEGQYDAFFKESSTLTGSGAGIGGRTAYDPMFVPLRLANPMRGVSRNVSTEGATYQFRAKIGNTGPAWGYTIQNNGAGTTVGTNIWQLTLQDLNVQFPIRTAALDDIDGLESNVVSDMLVEFSEVEALSMIKNDDQDAGAAYGGTNGLRGLNQYAGAAATYAPGQITTAAFGTTGTGSSSGLHSIATYDQITTNAAGSANNVSYKDLIDFIHDLPQQYWTPGCRFIINPLMLAGIRGLVDDNGTPVFERMAPLETNGIVGRLLGFDVVVNKYLDNPTAPDAAPGTDSLYPMYFGDWSRGHTIVDRLNMVMRRYDQTLPGFITFYGEKRLCTSVVDPFSIIRYRSTATGVL
jgi:hypothetical protein